ncbi:MAG: patatin-like phospholipase family protein [Bryobacteraceae bacterium]
MEKKTFIQAQEAEADVLGGAPDSALCLSGGGIRSATFGLGVLQGLARLGLLDRFHYLSTVSGGGYIGGWLTAWKHNFANGNTTDDPKKCLGNGLCAPVHHLRQFSNYLSPSLGLFSASSWTLVSTYMRNLLLNWLVLFPLFFAGMAIPRLLVAMLPAPGVPSDSAHWWAAAAVLGMGWFFALVAFSRISKWLPGMRWQESPALENENEFVRLHVAMQILAYACIAGPWLYLRDPLAPRWLDWWSELKRWNAFFTFFLSLTAIGWWWGQRKVRRYEASDFATSFTFALSGSILCWRMAKVSGFFEDPVLYTVVAVPMLAATVLVVSFVVIGVQSFTGFRRPAGDADREWWARAAGWVLIAALGWLLLTSISLYGPWVLLRFKESIGAWWVSVGGTLSGALSAYIAWKARPFVASLLTRKDGKSRAGRIALAAAEKVLAPVFLFFLFSELSLLISWAQNGWTIPTAACHLDMLTSTAAWMWAAGVMVAGLVFGNAAGWVLSVNRFSLNAMYRNRLIRAYLGASRKRNPDVLTGFDEKDNVALAAISAAQRPYHVLNLTLNITTGEELAWQKRQAQSFTASPLYCGFADSYVPTSGYTDGGLSLGTAVSVSGAAASPNMGSYTSKLLTIVMTLFNARLGLWLPNPKTAHAETLASSEPRSRLILLKELLGLAGAHQQWIYLSDGGHFENLGLYEMARRKLKFIFVSDASADPNFELKDLANAIEKIRVDLGYAVEFLGTPAFHRKLDAPGLHCALLRVRYSDEESGLIVYVKPSFSGVERTLSPDVYRYAKDHSQFPHQSTADQFFDETQFECYRRLGEQTIERITAEWRGPHNVESFFDHVQRVYLRHAEEAPKSEEEPAKEE